MRKLEFKDLGLSEEILESIGKLGYKTPSSIQEKVIPIILKNRDIIAKAKTGSGKTAAFAIPICEKIELEEKAPQVLVLTPTRELAYQIKEDFLNIGRFKRLRCVSIFGKEPISNQIRELKQRCHIVVGTPGRILDHIERETLNLSKIKYVVIDEADEMLNMGFIEQVEGILSKLEKNRNTLLFSATLPETIVNLSEKYMKNAENVEVKDEASSKGEIEELYYKVEAREKFSLLVKLIYKELPGSSIVFCRTKDNVEEVFGKMKDKGFICGALHGGMLQQDRIQVMNDFKKGKFTFLVATDVAARGIDVENITHVINYDIPMEKESYIHRIGRTGRMGNRGKAITFVTMKEERFLKDIENEFSRDIKEGNMPTKEEVLKGRETLKSTSQKLNKTKHNKIEKLNKDITKLHLSAGKKKKIRPGDIAGTISSIEGINPEDIGIIDIHDSFSYVEILNGKGNVVIKAMESKTIKGKKVRAQVAQK
ncbi:DEAD/DEAH box helicase [Clostridium felsineum]|uniref:DEAD/DEAH box helicase n=1 Tax=Clostridium felsineum TaxID=36839 RepID=UPI00214D5144|nr:DEAD/DEAH box helicase [Clostridium felsineum]MCR3760863.1 DEAD/DEAH box helicase [Clostridium felsineum]